MSETRQRKYDLEVLIRSRYPLVYIVSWEEKRVMDALEDIGRRLGKKVFAWSLLSGLVQVGAPGGPGARPPVNRASADPLVALREAADYKEPAIFVFKDFHPFLTRNNASVLRSLREIALVNSFKTVALTGPALNLPPDLEKDVTVLDFPLPGLAELNELLENAARETAAHPQLTVDLAGDAREEILKAVQGLTLAEAENVFAKTLVVHGRLGSAQIPDILLEKRQIIRKSGLLDYREPEVSLAEVGGLENLKEWLVKRRPAFSDRARAFGLPSPRGVLLLGVQGCGKSMCAKAVSALWQLPLLRLDVGRIFDSLVGGSEENIRRAIAIAEGVAPCILWVDEIDKAFGGLGGASGDSGVSQRVLGSFLTWLAEKSSAVFVAATANNVSALPPELLRKGRLDEIFFVDLPSQAERESILDIHLRRLGRDPAGFDLPRLARAAEGFSGAEIEQALVSALFDAFYDQGRAVTGEDILKAMNETVPLSRTMEEEIERLRQWCAPRARPASSAGTGRAAAPSRLADLPFPSQEVL